MDAGVEMSGTVIVVPCYNEAQRLDRRAFEAWVDAGNPQRFLFVNDGSTDDTAVLLASLAEARPSAFSWLDVQPNGGKAEAVRKGIQHALGSGPDAVGFWDADLATPLSALPDFEARLSADPAILMVFGSRVRLLGRDIDRQAVRHYLGRVGATIASGVLGLPIYDTQCGAKLFRNTPLTASLFAEPFTVNWMFDVEILARFIRARERAGAPPAEQAVYELPLTEWHDVAGSKVKAKDFPKAFIELARIWMTYHP